MVEHATLRVKHERSGDTGFLATELSYGRQSIKEKMPDYSKYNFNDSTGAFRGINRTMSIETNNG